NSLSKISDPMWEPLYDNFSKYAALTQAEFEICKSSFTTKRFRKRQFILQDGEICRWETFIVSGCARIYEVDEKGQEHVLQFGLEGWWVGDLYSFLTLHPSTLCIDCLEDCEVLQISKTNLDLLYGIVPKLERFFRILMQNAFIASQKRILTKLAKPALEQYIEFINKYPTIEQRVPDHQIASYLGITPQSLSRIRKQNQL
ncbi:MAG: Crp/Fnr family transcriptional regulator, partial [Chitinophagaceae bacterium]